MSVNISESTISLASKRMALPDRLVFLLLNIVIFGDLLLPAISFYGIGFRVGDIALLLLSPFVVLGVIKKRPLIILYLGYLLTVFFSLLNSYAFLGISVSGRDFNEFIRVSLPFIALLYSYQLKMNKSRFIIVFKRLVFFASLFILTMGVLQFLYPRNIGRILASIYAPEHHVANVSKRILLIGTDPNIGAAITLLFILFNLSFFIATKKTNFGLLALMLGVAAIFTGSRTGLITIFAGISFTFLFSNIKNKRKILSSLFFLGVFLFVFIMVALTVPYITKGIKSILSGENNSLNVRVQNFKSTFALFKESPFLGWGPAKAIHTTIVDGEWFLILRRYGAMGTVFVFLFLTKAITSLLSTSKLLSGSFPLESALCVAVAGFFFAMFFLMLTNNFVFSYQLFKPAVCIAGILHNYSYKRDII